jgi:hypothetical protein
MHSFRAVFLAEVFMENGPQAVNGSLWTIKLEVGFYILVLLTACILNRLKINNSRRKRRGIEDFSLSSLRMWWNKSPTPPVLRPKGRGIKPTFG